MAFTKRVAFRHVILQFVDQRLVYAVNFAELHLALLSIKICILMPLHLLHVLLVAHEEDGEARLFLVYLRNKGGRFALDHLLNGAWTVALPFKVVVGLPILYAGLRVQ